MVNPCELSLNVVRLDKPKMLSGLSQKAMQRVQRLNNPLGWAENAAGEEREPKPIRSVQRNTVSPYRSPSRVGELQSRPTAVRVEDEGESEGRPVIGRIRVMT